VDLIQQGVASPPTQNDGKWTYAPDSTLIKDGRHFLVSRATAGAFGKTYALKYTVTDAKGCINSNSVDLLVNDTPEVVLRDISLCGWTDEVDILDRVSQFGAPKWISQGTYNLITGGADKD